MKRRIIRIDLEMRIFDSSVGSDDYVIYNEDCLQTSKRLAASTIDLIYVDPPFFTGRLYDVNGFGFSDKWIDTEEYLNWIRPRLAAFKRLLKLTGSVYIHCDWHISHYLKVLADSIFGRSNFLNEIVWKRQSAHNDVQQGSRHFGRIHDTILVYRRSANYIWNQLYTEYESQYLERTYRYVETGTNRKYALGDLTGPGGIGKGNPLYDFLGVRRCWRYSRERMQELLDEGKIVSKKGRVPMLIRYLDEMKGKPLQDVWTDIKLEHYAKIKFPTQKPEVLLERIVSTSSNPQQMVYDPFAGSGTSGAACFGLSRKWIGSDISKKACELASARLEALGCKTRICSGNIDQSNQFSPHQRTG